MKNKIENESQDENKINFNDIKEIISKISNLVLANISNEEIKITEKINSNRVDIILGLKIPGIKASFENIKKKIKEYY